MRSRFSLDSVNAKVNGLVNLVNSVNSGSKLIDAIGTQMHLSVCLPSRLLYIAAADRPSGRWLGWGACRSAKAGKREC